MSNRLKLKNLQRHLYYEQKKRKQQDKEIEMLTRLVHRDFIEIGGRTRFTPMDTMCATAECYDQAVWKMLDAIAREWIKQAKPIVQKQLQLHSLEHIIDVVGVRVVVPRPNDENVKVITKSANWTVYDP